MLVTPFCFNTVIISIQLQHRPSIDDQNITVAVFTLGTLIITMANKMVIIFIFKGILSNVSGKSDNSPFTKNFLQIERGDLCPDGQNWCEV